MRSAFKHYYLAFLPLVLACVLCFAACTEARSNRNGRKPAVGNEDTWCIAKPSADETKLGNNIEFSCKELGVDCSSIDPDGSCFYPNNVVSHASVVMNLHYRAAGKHTWDCFFNGTGITVTVDPSVGDCTYAV